MVSDSKCNEGGGNEEKEEGALVTNDTGSTVLAGVSELSLGPSDETQLVAIGGGNAGQTADNNDDNNNVINDDTLLFNHHLTN